MEVSRLAPSWLRFWLKRNEAGVKLQSGEAETPEQEKQDLFAAEAASPARKKAKKQAYKNNNEMNVVKIDLDGQEVQVLWGGKKPSRMGLARAAGCRHDHGGVQGARARRRVLHGSGQAILRKKEKHQEFREGGGAGGCRAE